MNGKFESKVAKKLAQARELCKTIANTDGCGKCVNNLSGWGPDGCIMRILVYSVLNNHRTYEISDVDLPREQITIKTERRYNFGGNALPEKWTDDDIMGISALLENPY